MDVPMKEVISVLGINGSPAKTGKCARLLGKALKESALLGAKTQSIHLANYEKELFTLRHVDYPPSKTVALLAQVQEADCLIIATPVHWFGISSLTKNFLDHLSTLEAKNFLLEGKIVGFIAVLEEDGGMKAVLDMAGPLNHMGAMIPPYAMFFNNRRVAKSSERKWMLKDHRLVGSNVVRLAQVTQDQNWSYSGGTKGVRSHFL
jgi:multimeric flavodoxin WrbA